MSLGKILSLQTIHLGVLPPSKCGHHRFASLYRSFASPEATAAAIFFEIRARKTAVRLMDISRGFKSKHPLSFGVSVR